jgi:hypothetical protein
MNCGGNAAQNAHANFIVHKTQSVKTVQLELPTGIVTLTFWHVVHR